MYNIKKITFDTMEEFSNKIDYAKNNFIPMLPFIKMPFHDFDRYKSYTDKGIFLIDYLKEAYCLYHLYHITPGDRTLRASLILPSGWHERFGIVEESIKNLKDWFFKEDSSERFIIQSLEYGEIEYYPTLSHYLIPTIIRNGFEPQYRMYMKRTAGTIADKTVELKEGLELVGYSENILDAIIDFYYKNESAKNAMYFSNCEYSEFSEIMQQDFAIKNARFIKNTEGAIIAGIIPSIDSGKIWIDNFSIHPDYDKDSVSEYLLSETIQYMFKNCSEEDIYIYLNRDCRNAISACTEKGFVPFEFWVDMTLYR